MTAVNLVALEFRGSNSMWPGMFVGTQYLFHIELERHQFIRLYRIPEVLPKKIEDELLPIFWNKDQILNFSFPDEVKFRTNPYTMHDFPFMHIQNVLNAMRELPETVFV